jgi:hypothetical protein
MSTSLAESKILEFLASNSASVFCLRGRWGVGKTHIWKAAMRKAALDKRSGAMRYAYVSLFGRNSLDDLRNAIFEATVDLGKDSDRLPQSRPAPLPGLKKLIEAVPASWKTNAPKLARGAASTTVRWIAENYLGDASRLPFLLVRDQVVCLDDLERAGADLKIADVLGLASQLKEQRACKVALILNDESLDADDAYWGVFEKVVDSHVVLTPLVEEATAIALSDRDSLSDAISINCKALGITNIRIIRKIRSVSSELLRILSANDKAIQAHAIDSVSLLVWSVLRGEGAPSIQHLRSLTRYSFMSGKQAPSDQEAAWNSLLAAYGFAGLEEIDRLILEGIESGFFDPRPLQAEGAQLDATQAASRSAAEFRATWRTLWDSFDGAADRVLPHVVKSFYDHIQYLGPSDLNAVVGVLKELGWATDARKLIDSYVSTRGDDRDSLRLDAVPQPVDPDVAAALSRRVASIKDTRKLGEIQLGI